MTRRNMQLRKLRARMLADVEPPAYAHEGDAGLDLRAAEDVTVQPGQSRLVGLGVAVEIPEGCVGLVFPRSGLGSRGITLRNAVGVIDSGYRGEVKAALWNTTDDLFDVHTGDRIAQLVVMPYVPCKLEVTDELSESERGTGGYGSTGVK